MTDAPAQKPADDFEALMGAIERLQHVIKSMGHRATVAEIRLQPGYGRHEVERAIKASPSYLNIAWFPATGSAHEPQLSDGVICEVMGVKIVGRM
jgi:hypothetical protein